jgi:hypothetical protein
LKTNIVELGAKVIGLKEAVIANTTTMLRNIEGGLGIDTPGANKHVGWSTGLLPGEADPNLKGYKPHIETATEKDTKALYRLHKEQEKMSLPIQQKGESDKAYKARIDQSKLFDNALNAVDTLTPEQKATAEKKGAFGKLVGNGKRDASGIITPASSADITKAIYALIKELQTPVVVHNQPGRKS